MQVQIDTSAAENMLKFCTTKNVIDTPKLKKFIRAELKPIVADIRRGFVAQTKNKDPRQARQGIRFAVYKRYIGGTVTLENARKSASKMIRQKKVRNRRASDKTEQINSYYGTDRAFILRMHQMGNAYRGNHMKGFFDPAAGRMQKAADNTTQFIDAELQKTLDKY